MRVVGGRLRSRADRRAESRTAVRPTADRLRESLFNILVSRLRRPGQRRARARPVRRHRRTRHRGGVARRGLRAVRRRGRGGARAAARQYRDRWASAASPAFSAATRPNWVLRIRSSRSRLSFLDPPYGKGLAEKALVAAHDGGWLVARALAVVEEAARRQVQGAGRIRGTGAARLRRYANWYSCAAP